jgi:putative acetyltransferase
MEVLKKKTMPAGQVPPNSLRIRPEESTNQADRSAIRTVNIAAFGGPAEADLVDNLRAQRHALVSLVAEQDREIVGHILFSRMWIQAPAASVPAVALAPLAVLPKHQRKGIGGQLVLQGLALLRVAGESIVIVVGHPGYYPKFGFSTDRARLLQSPFPPDAFMAAELSLGALTGLQGIVQYPAAFGI